MRSLKMLGATVTLTLAFTLTTFGDCPQPIPGDILTPPCTSAAKAPDETAAPGETYVPSASNAEDAFTISDATIGILLSALSII